jgi:hypothetical protein
MSKPKSELIINSLTEQVRSLLEDHWSECERVFSGVDTMKIGVMLNIEFEGADARCKATIGFGSRVKDSSEATVHDESSELPGMTVTVEKGKRRRDGH